MCSSDLRSIRSVRFNLVCCLLEEVDRHHEIRPSSCASSASTPSATPKTFAHRISDLKNELVTPAQFAEEAVTSNPLERHLAEVYPAYQARLGAANALDFDDLIMRAVFLLQTRPAMAEMYRRRFRHILVD